MLRKDVELTLFEGYLNYNRRSAPLSTRMRPRSLDDYVGQEDLIDVGRPLRRAIEEDSLPSLIFWGPPGCGKTTLARIIATITKFHFVQRSAVNTGVAELRNQIAVAAENLKMSGQRTILFIDEIHRFSKSQQDSLLPHLEEGTVVLIGATTENPSFEVIPPLLSRTRVYTLNPLTDSHIETLVRRACIEQENGLGNMHLVLTEGAVAEILHVAGGDARTALDCLELVANIAPEENGTRTIVAEDVAQALQSQTHYDKQGDAHYNTISAFIKSVRSSDPDAALYYLARMINAGEDPMFIARRLVVLATEDIGLANPQGLVLASAAQQVVHLIGMPEGRIPLAETTVYLACSPKSNSAYSAIDNALKYVRSHPDEPIPMHLRNAPTRLMREQGYAKGYKYSHLHPGQFVPTDNLPDKASKQRFYLPHTDNTVESRIALQLQKWWGTKYSLPQPHATQQPETQQ